MLKLVHYCKCDVWFADYTIVILIFKKKVDHKINRIVNAFDAMLWRRLRTGATLATTRWFYASLTSQTLVDLGSDSENGKWYIR